jgi:hypothetical protein
MKKVLILVEGSTEESFIKRVLSHHLFLRDIIIIPTIITTKRVKIGSDFKGGIVSYQKVRKEILNLLGDQSAHLVTTMFDFYGLPGDFPGCRGLSGNPQEKVSEVEKRVNNDINNPRFYSYFSLHEFEGLLFSSPSTISRTLYQPDKEKTLCKIRNSFPTPEDIDDNPETAPSKRIKTVFPQYEKVVHGSIIAGRIGLETLRSECPHFHEWLERIEHIT